MTPRTRSLAALLGTLALGIILGLLFGSRVAARRFDRLGGMGQPHQLLCFLQEELALSPGQQVVVDSLLEEQAVQVSRRIRDHHRLMRSQMDSLLQSMKPHLSAEQWTRLQKQLSRPPRRGPGVGPEGGGFGVRGPGGRRHRGGGFPPDSMDGPPPPPTRR